MFIVGVLDGKTERYKMNSESHLLDRIKESVNKSPRIRTFNFDWPNKSDIPSRLADVLEDEVEDKYYLPDEMVGELLQLLQQEVQVAWSDTNEKTKPIQVALQLDFDEKPRINVLGLANIRGFEIVRRVYDPMGLSPTLTTMEGGHREPKILVERQTKDGPELAVRKVTPLECFRLQGFPDDYYRLLRESGFSDRQLYKLAGNAVTVDIVRDLALSLIGKY